MLNVTKHHHATYAFVLNEVCDSFFFIVIIITLIFWIIDMQVYNIQCVCVCVLIIE